MDIISLISENATSVSLAIVVMWFYNKLVIDFLAERKEIIEALRTERKEWVGQSNTYFNQLLDINYKTVESIGRLDAEVHSLRGKISELILAYGKGGLKNDNN